MNKLFSIVKPLRVNNKSNIVVFSVVADELYLLPHFLAHHRVLGVEQFLFYVDYSTDGTLEYLSAQDDCAIVTSPKAFGDPMIFSARGQKISQRFGIFCKTYFPSIFLKGKWVIILDADEFLFLPRPSTSINDFVARLYENGLQSCRALMIDFFPNKLSELSDCDRSCSPFNLAPYFDAHSVNWPNNTIRPINYDTSPTIRNRIVDEQERREALPVEIVKKQKLNWMYKSPITRWTPNTFYYHSHTSNHIQSDKVQVVLAHFKFYPGWGKKVSNAMRDKQYYRGSIKYQPLHYAYKYLQDWSLVASHSIRFVDTNDFINEGLLFDNIKT